MCEFCEKHGEGKKWYLNTRNYSHDLLSDLERKKFIKGFYRDTVEQGHEGLLKLEKIHRERGRIPSFITSRFVARNKEMHYGQVLPIEDVKTIFDMSSSIARIACGCRWAAQKKEVRCCFGITFDPSHWYKDFDTDYFGTPDLSQHEAVSPDTAMEMVSRFDREGLIHSVWTFMTPFIGGICNCGIEGCLAMRATHGLGMPAMFRAEYVAAIEAATCTGCRACERLCPVQAIEHLPAAKRCAVDLTKCYGCGVCRSACKTGAIALKERAADPVAGHIW